MKTFYQILQDENYPPEDQIDKKILFVAKSPTGKLALGIGDKILVAENDQEAFKETRRMNFLYELFDQTPEQVLSYILHIKKLAEEMRNNGGDQNEKD